MSHRPSLIDRLAIALASLAISAAIAPVAAAASLSIKAPGRVKHGHVFKVVVKGRYRRSQLTGTAFLVIAIQPSAGACQSTAQQENQVAFVNVYFHGSVPHSPFKASQKFKAVGKGSRRVCAYLYPRFITTTSGVGPIATASKRYRTK